MIQNLISQMLDLIFSWRYLAGFISGLIAQQAFIRLYHLYERRNSPYGVKVNSPGGVSYTWAMSVLAFAVVGLMMYSTQQNYLAWKCQRELIVTMNARTLLRDQSDDLIEERDALLMKWIHDLVQPPPEYLMLSLNDPRRQEWMNQRTIEINALYAASMSHQEALEKSRPAYHLDTCTPDNRW